MMILYASVEISISHLTHLMFSSPSFKITPPFTTTLNLINGPSHTNSPSRYFGLAISAVLPPLTQLLSGPVAVLALSLMLPDVSLQPFYHFMIRPFNGLMWMRSRKHQTGWRVYHAVPGGRAFAWLMEPSFLLRPSPDTLGSSFLTVSPIIHSVLR